MSMNVLNLFTSPLTPKDEMSKYFIEQEELKCDPLYLGIVIGTTHILFEKMKKQHDEETSLSTQSGKTPTPLKGIKIGFNAEDCSITTNRPGFFSQTVVRTWNGQSQKELEWIRPHLVQLLRWCDFEAPMFKTILVFYKYGLEDILWGYKNKYAKEKTLTQTPQKIENQPPPVPVKLKVKIGTPETNAILRILEADIALLEKAIAINAAKNSKLESNPDSTQKDSANLVRASTNEKEKEQPSQENQKKLEDEERRAKKFKQKLQREYIKYFPLQNQLKLIKEASTIDDYMKEQMRTRWDQKTLQGIVDLFESNPHGSFNRVESITSLVAQIPSAQLNSRTTLRNLINLTLANCSFETENTSPPKQENQ